MANKTYQRRIFGGKDAEWRGIDQGKGKMHPNAIGMSMNVTYDDNLFKTRIGQFAEELATLGEVV